MCGSRFDAIQAPWVVAADVIVYSTGSVCGVFKCGRTRAQYCAEGHKLCDDHFASCLRDLWRHGLVYSSLRAGNLFSLYVSSSSSEATIFVARTHVVSSAHCAHQDSVFVGGGILGVSRE